MKVALHLNQLDGRGGGIQVYKYAKYMRELLGWEPIIVSSSITANSTFERFKKEFNLSLYPFEWQNDGKNSKIVEYFNKIISSEKIDFLYAFKGGEDDGILTDVACKTMAHCVFRMDEPHGDIYAGICQYMSEKHGAVHPWVDHIFDYPKLSPEDNLRKELNIPEEALVGFRHGGEKQFSLPFTYNAIAMALENRADLWFIFLNTKKFIDHPRVLFLEWTSDLNRILKFVNTGDFLMHGRMDGEVMSLTVAEASMQNKAVVTWKPEQVPNFYDVGHLYLLKEKAICYKDGKDLFEILMRLDKDKLRSQDWDVYKDKYSAKNVMKQFEDIVGEG